MPQRLIDFTSHFALKSRRLAVPQMSLLDREDGLDRLLDDPVFFAPFVARFDPQFGRPSIPMETYLRLMFLKFR